MPAVAVPGTPQLAVLDSQVISATVTNPDGTTTVRSFVTIKGMNPDKKPWVIRLDNSGAVAERSLNQPLVVAGVVFFTTFVPSNNPCAGNGKSYLYGVNYLTGEPVTKTVFDTNNDGVYDDQDKIYIDAGGNATVGTDDPTGKTVVQVAGIDLGAGQASNPVMEQGVIFVSTTDPGDDGGGGGIDGGGIATPVDLEGMKANLGSWRDLSF